jgi:hypothetical protein
MPDWKSRGTGVKAREWVQAFRMVNRMFTTDFTELWSLITLFLTARKNEVCVSFAS